jgi:tetratricopeptide (TPR) repeat protein
MNCEGMQAKISLLYKQKRYKETEDKIYELLNYYKNRGYILKTDISELCHCYIKLANIERRKDNYEQGIEIAKLALLYSTSEAEKHQCFNIMGICYKYLGQIPIALKYYDKCIMFYCQIKDTIKLVKVLKCKALMLRDEQLLKDIKDTLKKSDEFDLVLYEDLKTTLNEMIIYNNNKNANISNTINLDTYKALRNKTGK